MSSVDEGSEDVDAALSLDAVGAALIPSSAVELAVGLSVGDKVTDELSLVAEPVGAEVVDVLAGAELVG